MANKQAKKTLTEAEQEAYALVGRHGGRATVKKYGKEHMSKIGRKGAKKRWLKNATKNKL
jgi:general stress protein YciG